MSMQCVRCEATTTKDRCPNCDSTDLKFKPDTGSMKSPVAGGKPPIVAHDMGRGASLSSSIASRSTLGRRISHDGTSSGGKDSRTKVHPVGSRRIKGATGSSPTGERSIPKKSDPKPHEEKKTPVNRAFLWLGVALAVLVLIGIIVAITNAGMEDFDGPEPKVPVAVAAAITASTPTATTSLKPTPQPSPSPSPSPTPLPSATPLASPTPAPTVLSSPRFARLTGERVNIRERPNLESAVLVAGRRNSRLEILEEPTDGWYQVRIETTDGTEQGWVFGAFVSPPSNSLLPMRTKDGSTITLLDRNGRTLSRGNTTVDRILVVATTGELFEARLPGGEQVFVRPTGLVEVE